jgi:hypothetical protein
VHFVTACVVRTDLAAVATSLRASRQATAVQGVEDNLFTERRLQMAFGQRKSERVTFERGVEVFIMGSMAPGGAIA